MDRRLSRWLRIRKTNVLISWKSERTQAEHLGEIAANAISRLPLRAGQGTLSKRS